MWWQNKGYNLIQHGDRYERLWWPLLKNDFPEYERFWINHVIPLTNRIDPAIPETDPRWIGFRDDPRISNQLEAMAMAHYSTFYFLARETKLTPLEPHIYFEDAFALLAAATENADQFVKVWQRGLTRDLKLPCSPLHGINVMSWPPVEVIHLYRNVMLHAPVLGRAHYLNAEFLPKKQFLQKPGHTGRGLRSKVGVAWRALQKLTSADFVEGRGLLADLRAELLKSLRGAWETICEFADKASDKNEYRELYNLDERCFIRGRSVSVDGASASEPMLDLSSPAASGFAQVPASPTSNLLLDHFQIKPKP